MARPVVLSNGQLFVGIDENGLVHDFYYPYVGLENLTNARSSQHKIGVWANGTFSWTDDGNWEISVDFASDALVSTVTMVNHGLNVSLEFNDFVDSEYNALIRRIKVVNTGQSDQDIRLFMHQVFQISRAGRADTAMYVPDDNYILDYKGRCCLLIAGRTSDKADFDQYATGNYSIEGKAGTYKDAEDGELSNNAVEHGGVDSVIRFQKLLKPAQSLLVDYWIVAANSQSDAQLIHTKLKYYPIEDRLASTRAAFREWLQQGKDKLELIPQKYRLEAQKSLLIIKAHCDERGSILASGDSSIFNYGRDYYCYCWPRDAAFVLWPLLRMGYFDEARTFFGFARDTLHRDGYAMHKYQPDRAIGSTWHPLIHGKSKELAIQEDETSILLFMLGVYYETSQDLGFIESLYDSFVVPCANFMCGFIDDATDLPHASYDLWEERFLTSTYTVCSVISGLQAASELAHAVNRPDDALRWKKTIERLARAFHKLYSAKGYYAKGFLMQEDGSIELDETLDISSLYGIYMFAKLPASDQRLISTAQAVEHKLKATTPAGGVLRYEGDNYFLTKQQYKGNPWIVCSLWLAQYYLGIGEQAKAEELLDWSLQRALPSGALSEQFDPETGEAISVTPLVWSHAEFLNTVLDLDSNADKPSGA